MSSRARSTDRQVVGGAVSVYLEDDRIEVGTTNAVCQEEMRRLSYRDVRRIVTWPDYRKAHRAKAIALGDN